MDRDLLLHTPEPFRRLLLIHRLPRLALPIPIPTRSPSPASRSLTLMPKLRLTHAHHRLWVADPQLRIVQHRNRERNALFLEVHDQSVAGEGAIVACVEFDFRVAVVVFLEHAALGEARGELVGGRV